MTGAPFTITDSATLRRCIELNPHNIGGGYNGAPHLCALDAAAARFEQEGRNAYPHGRNPYAASTMAGKRWAAGWHQADALACGDVA